MAINLSKCERLSVKWCRPRNMQAAFVVTRADGKKYAVRDTKGAMLPYGLVCDVLSGDNITAQCTVSGNVLKVDPYSIRFIP